MASDPTTPTTPHSDPRTSADDGGTHAADAARSVTGTTAGAGWRGWAHPLQSVRVRITLAAVLVTALAVGTAGWLLVRSVEDTQLGQLRDEINADLDEVVAQLEEGGDPQEAVDAASATDPSFLEVSDGDGTVVASAPTFVRGGQSFSIRLGGTPSGTDEPLVDETTSRTAGTATGPDAAGQTTSSIVLGDGDGDGGGQPLPSPPPEAPGRTVLAYRGGLAGPLERISRTVATEAGTFTVTAAAPVDQLAGSVAALRQGLAFGLPVLVALVAATAWVLVGRALRPVEAIRAEVDAITGSTMHRRVPEPPTSDEIGRLARTMNAMLARLDATATRQRQFVSDASHELRSPVAAIRTGLEVARRSPDRADWPAVADAALAEELRLEGLLDDLLLLASQDENGAAGDDRGPAHRARVDLVAVATAEAGRPRRVPVDLVPPPADDLVLALEGDGEQLARAVGNLVDNAARYASSSVQISVSHHDGVARLVVDDDGPGIAPADRERVFERFTRLDDSRARHRGGSGLGLAVVRSIVDRHHGRVRAERSPLGGARFVTELPTVAVVDDTTTGPSR
jgi:signal transduction histidine kinase